MRPDMLLYVYEFSLEINRKVTYNLLCIFSMRNNQVVQIKKKQ